MNKLFLGRGWKFPIQVDPATGKIKMSQYEEDIEEAIRIILWTGKGERVMRSDFGCGIHEYAFDTTDPTTLRLMETEITEAIQAWEPRVEDVEIRLKPDETQSEKLLIHIQYRVRSTNNLFNRVYPYYIHEGSH